MTEKRVKIEGFWYELPHDVSCIVIPNGNRYEIKRNGNTFGASLVGNVNGGQE
ncbi:MAG: hypothetical protein ACTSRS_22795 [Candidatus Helarchaeota archaeon]